MALAPLFLKGMNHTSQQMIPTNGIRLHAEVYEPNGDPVIFLHFSGGHLGVWREVLPYFRPDYQVLLLSMRGCGHSDKPATGHTIEQMARDVVGAMDTLGLARAHLVGSSMGAEIAARLAADFPDRVISLVLEGAFQNPTGPHGEVDVPPEQLEARLEEIRAMRRARPPLEADTPEAVLRLTLERWGMPEAASTPLGRGLAEGIGPVGEGRYASLCPGWVVDQYIEDFWTARFDRYYEQIACPVLFLPDERSAGTEPVQASLAWFRSLLKGHSEVQIIPGAQHAAMILTHAAPFSGTVRAFFERVK